MITFVLKLVMFLIMVLISTSCGQSFSQLRQNVLVATQMTQQGVEASEARVKRFLANAAEYQAWLNTAQEQGLEIGELSVLPYATWSHFPEGQDTLVHFYQTIVFQNARNKSTGAVSSHFLKLAVMNSADEAVSFSEDSLRFVKHANVTEGIDSKKPISEQVFEAYKRDKDAQNSLNEYKNYYKKDCKPTDLNVNAMTAGTDGAARFIVYKGAYIKRPGVDNTEHNMLMFHDVKVISLQDGKAAITRVLPASVTLVPQLDDAQNKSDR